MEWKENLEILIMVILLFCIGYFFMGMIPICDCGDQVVDYSCRMFFN